MSCEDELQRLEEELRKLNIELNEKAKAIIMLQSKADALMAINKSLQSDLEECQWENQ